MYRMSFFLCAGLLIINFSLWGFTERMFKLNVASRLEAFLVARDKLSVLKDFVLEGSNLGMRDAM